MVEHEVGMSCGNLDIPLLVISLFLSVSVLGAGPALSDVRNGVSKVDTTLARNRAAASSHSNYRVASSDSRFLHGSLKLGQCVNTRSISQSHTLMGVTVCSQTSPLSTAAGSTAWELNEAEEDSRNGVLFSNGSANQRVADDRDCPFYGDRSRSYSTVAGVQNSDWGDVEAYDTFSDEQDSEDDEDSEVEEGEVVHVPAHADESRDDLAVENLGISDVLVNALIARGIARLFPIQVRRHRNKERVTICKGAMVALKKHDERPPGQIYDSLRILRHVVLTLTCTPYPESQEALMKL